MGGKTFLFIFVGCEQLVHLTGFLWIPRKRRHAHDKRVLSGPMAGPVIYELSDKRINIGSIHHLDLMEFIGSHESFCTFRQTYSQKQVFYLYSLVDLCRGQWHPRKRWNASIMNAKNSYTNVRFCCTCSLREYSCHYTNKKDRKIVLENRSLLIKVACFCFIILC